MIKINGKMILLGDTHFGVDRFSLSVLNNQMLLIENQLIPYMKENNINKIFQLGDLFDNRVNININFLQVLQKRFFDLLKEENIHLYCLTGNHDIYFKESREVSLLHLINEKYDNFTLFNEITTIEINNARTLIVPWLTSSEKITKNDLIDIENVFGHFEIRNFQLIKGFRDDNSALTSDFFKYNKGTELSSVKNVFSGHYHIKDSDGLINYIGTPWQLSFSDFQENKGFYSFFDSTEEPLFILNESSKRYLKIIFSSFNDSKIILKGLENYVKGDTPSDIEEIVEYCKGNKIQVIIESKRTKLLNSLLDSLKHNNIDFSILDEYLMKVIIKENKIEMKSDEDISYDTNKNHMTSKKMILNRVQKEDKTLVPLLLDIMDSIEENKG